jgi:hypothetical protein
MEGVKQPVPAPADQQKAEKTIDDDYQAELTRPRQADRIALAKTLIDAACQLSNSAAERYMMLIKARDLAAGAGDLESADAACWELSAATAAARRSSTAGECRSSASAARPIRPANTPASASSTWHRSTRKPPAKDDPAQLNRLEVPKFPF